MTPPTLSLIIVNFQSAALIRQALPSWLKAMESIPAEFIVVNNDVLEERAIDEMAKEFPLRVKHLGSNFGFATGSNAGAKLALGTNLLFINPDTWHMSGSIQSLLRVVADHPHAVGGVRLTTREGNAEPWSSGDFPSAWSLLRKTLCGWPVRPVWAEKQFRLTDWVSGAALIIPKAYFESLGGFDEQYFLYFEDVDLCRRVKAQGGAVWFYPFFVVGHQGGSSHADGLQQKAWYYASQRRYFAKHRPQWEWRLLVWLHQLLGRSH